MGFDGSEDGVLAGDDHCARSKVAAISAMRRPSARGEGRRSGGQRSQPRIADRIWSSARMIGTDEDVLKGGVLCTRSAWVIWISTPSWLGLEPRRKLALPLGLLI